jgi:hypothetical protein
VKKYANSIFYLNAIIEKKKESSMKKLPIGISTFKKIIDGNYLYVDKTKIALDLSENGGGYYFLSRQISM